MSKCWWMALVLLVCACGTDAPNEKATTACTTDSDCAVGTYCGEANACISDCDINTPCSIGSSCTVNGRCSAEGSVCEVNDDCDEPPVVLSCDGDVLVGYANVGVCDLSGANAACTYSQIRTPCELGCTATGCAADACESKLCDVAPAPRCGADGVTRITYESNGVCEGEGQCVYPEVADSCALGCVNGQCLQGACENIVCNTPRVSKCDGNVAMSYAALGTCDDTNGSPVCDYPLTFQHCGYVNGTCEDAMCIDGITQVGGVTIVEIMPNPAGGAREADEWFEITNTSGADIDLTGWKIVSKGTSADQEHVIAANMLTAVPAFTAGSTLLFTATATAAGVAQPDYVYSGVTLTNSTDWLALMNPNGEYVDYVFYETGAVVDGRSRKFNPAIAPSAAANDDFANWCPSLTDPYTNGPDNYGTPGAANTACAVDACAEFTCVKPDDFCTDRSTAVQFQANTAMCEVSRFNNPYCNYQATNVTCELAELCAVGVCETIPSNLPTPGDVIFSEIMADPSKVGDTSGEWFELYNTTAAPLSLFSVEFKDNETGSAVDVYPIMDINATIPANGYAVFAKVVDPALNGGVTGAYLFAGRHLKNTSDPLVYGLSLALADGTVIDSTYFGPSARGKAAQLDSTLFSAIGNDAGTAWCVATATYGLGDFGTPGSANIPCP